MSRTERMRDLAHAVLAKSAREADLHELATLVLTMTPETKPPCSSCDGFGFKPSGDWCYACQSYEVGSS